MVNLCYLVIHQPFDEAKVNRLEIMNEVTSFFLLYHVMLFSGLEPEPEKRYMIGRTFIVFCGGNMMVHFSLLIIETTIQIRDWLKKKCAKKKPVEVEQVKKELSVIAEESLESNFSEKDSVERKRAIKVSESNWDSQKMGGSEKGYNMAAIKWDDLGRKFTVKRGMKSCLPEMDPSEFEPGARCHTMDERFSEFRLKEGDFCDVNAVDPLCPSPNRAKEKKKLARHTSYQIEIRPSNVVEVSPDADSLAKQS